MGLSLFLGVFFYHWLSARNITLVEKKSNNNAEVHRGESTSHKTIPYTHATPLANLIELIFEKEKHCKWQ